MTEQKNVVPKFAEGFLAFIPKHPFLAMLAGLLLFMALAPGLPGLVPEFTHRGFFEPDDGVLGGFTLQGDVALTGLRTRLVRAAATPHSGPTAAPQRSGTI